MNSWQTNFYEKKVKPFFKFEVESSKRISKLYNVEIISFNNDNKYDFITSDDIKYEVKYDNYSNKSGNFFIEFFAYNKPSGISTSESNFYIITDGINYYLIDTQILLKLCVTFGTTTKTTKDKLTYGYIIPINIIISNSVSI